MQPSQRYGLIMAGGRGTRFWPRSRQTRAKQVLPLAGERSLIQQTVDRLRPLLPPERLFIVTNHHLRDQIVTQLPEVPPAQIIAEPAPRNTAPCIGLAAHLLQQIAPGASLGVFPADHWIEQPDAFLPIVDAAFSAAERGELVVLGIQPRWPETGYGYVEFHAGIEPGALSTRPVVQFREKPDLATAQTYLASGRFFWNSGMFFWTAQTILAALRQHLPQTLTLLASLPPLHDPGFPAALELAFPKCENISIDYAVLEKAANVTGIATSDFGWNDLGSWNAVYEIASKDDRGNAAKGDVLLLNASGNYVEGAGKLIALAGVDGLVVVDTPDALLVTTRERAQEVGRLVKALEEARRFDLL
jgi:mannose-1-phosphate guanylyltransferase